MAADGASSEDRVAIPVVKPAIAGDGADEAVSVPAPGGDDSAEAATEAAVPTIAAAPEPVPTTGAVWQIPVILVSTALIVIGIMRMGGGDPGHDFDGVFEQVRQRLGAGQFDQAEMLLRETAQPYIHEATVAQRGRFHALVGDWIALRSRDGGDAGAIRWVSADPEAPPSDAAQEIDVQYSRAVELGAQVGPPRIARWALALIAHGELDAARLKLAELDALDVSADAGASHRDARNRVFRALIEARLTSDDLDFDQTMDLLDVYRDDSRLAATDRAWAMAKQAELRLEADRPRAAIDHLLIDMRKLDGGSSIDAGRLYLLLGRAYETIGELEEAAYAADMALERLPETESLRGEALVLRARLALNDGSGGEERALAMFTDAADMYVSTPAWLPAMFGRAIVRSRRGDHDGALMDIAAITPRLRDGESHEAITATEVAARLIDRHDAALMNGRLELGVRYAEAAEGLFTREIVPPEVLQRLAATNRQLAMNATAADVSPGPAERASAARSFARAGDYFLRHARALVGDDEQTESWATSLKLAGESFDAGGRPDLAIACFQDYLAGRPADDPLRSSVTFQLAQAQHAEMNYDAAIELYEKVIADHPRSPDATASHVPLARCLIAQDRPKEAMQQLREVVDGRYALTPAAADYRDALIELGRIEHQQGLHVDAIETLRLAAERYGDDPRQGEVAYRLGDSHRRWALELRQQADEDVALSPGDRARRRTRARTSLEAAASYYDQALDTLGAPGRITADTDDVLIRNAMMHRADCAYELGQYQQAIGRYDDVARAYKTHVSSLTALIQIVNAYAALGDTDQMHIAHDRARHRLRELPDDAFASGGELADRDAWAEWLRHRPIGGPDRVANVNPEGVGPQ